MAFQIKTKDPCAAQAGMSLVLEASQPVGNPLERADDLPHAHAGVELLPHGIFCLDNYSNMHVECQCFQKRYESRSVEIGAPVGSSV